MDYGSIELEKILDFFENISTEEYSELYAKAGEYSENYVLCSPDAEQPNFGSNKIQTTLHNARFVVQESSSNIGIKTYRAQSPYFVTIKESNQFTANTANFDVEIQNLESA